MGLSDKLRDAKNTNQIFSRILDTNGDGTGIKNAVGDYSLAEEVLKITTGTNDILGVHRMIVQIRDTGAMAAEEYGAGAELTNGISTYINDGSNRIVDLTDGVPITTNAGWGRLCYDVDVKTWSTGDEILLVRYTFSKSGQAIGLPAGWSLEVSLNDDHSNLVEHYFTVQGTYLQDY